MTSLTIPATTPMMMQYLEIKAANADFLLFYRMGDFFELFFEDASIASQVLGISLTKRGKHQGEDIPMCGVPIHAAQDYLNKLISAGYKVALCEQMEDPAEAKKRGHKAVVRREVVRLITAGTLTEETLLSAGRYNYLAALAHIRHENGLALAWIDISTGDFHVTTTSKECLKSELARIAPRELILSDQFPSQEDFGDFLDRENVVLSPISATRFESSLAENRLKTYFKLETLEGLGHFSRAEISACGALLDYILLTQVGQMPHLNRPEKCHPEGFMLIDPATRMNLELTRHCSGERTGSLLWAIDTTLTSAGARMLGDWISSPMTYIPTLQARLDAVEFFVNHHSFCQKWRLLLKKIPDLGRALSRITLNRGSPRDLEIIKNGLNFAFELGELLCEHAATGARLPEMITTLKKTFCHSLSALWDVLETALVLSPPASLREGDVIQPGFDPALDQERTLRDKSQQVIAELESHYALETNIKALKIKHNNVLGYFIEVTQTHAERMLSPPWNERFTHRQTTVNATRFSTQELLDLEQKITLATERALALETEIIQRLVSDIKDHASSLLQISQAFALSDVLSALASLALERQWTRPILEDDVTFLIEQGRHPVVEHVLKKSAQATFVPNDCFLSHENDDQGALWLVTGPNMAGKSTFLRQNALICILAQIGSYVPAHRAHIGVCDRLFSRVGAADDLARGRSTFMVEMVETALILNQATPRSLVILDEIGRGTATFDGLSLAWACVEHLHDTNRSRALFATHFHELTALEHRLHRLKTVTVHVKEWEGDIIFLHRVGPGTADRSYGIHVAKLAGLPESVLHRARAIMEILEKNDPSSQKKGAMILDLPLFSPTNSPCSSFSKKEEKTQEEKEILSLLKNMNPDDFSGKMALDFLYTLKERMATLKT